MGLTSWFKWLINGITNLYFKGRLHLEVFHDYLCLGNPIWASNTAIHQLPALFYPHLHINKAKKERTSSPSPNMTNNQGVAHPLGGPRQLHSTLMVEGSQTAFWAPLPLFVLLGSALGGIFGLTSCWGGDCSLLPSPYQGAARLSGTLNQIDIERKGTRTQKMRTVTRKKISPVWRQQSIYCKATEGFKVTKSLCLQVS